LSSGVTSSLEFPFQVRENQWLNLCGSLADCLTGSSMALRRAVTCALPFSAKILPDLAAAASFRKNRTSAYLSRNINANWVVHATL